MNRPSLRLNALLVLVPLFLLSAVNWFNPDKPTVSEMENRALKAKPAFSVAALFSGKYTRDYEEYFADTFVFRDVFVRASKRVSELWSINRGVPALVSHKGANTADAQGAGGELIAYAGGDPYKSLLVLDGRAMELHRFSKTYSEYYAAFLNRFRGKVGSEVKVYSLLAPTQVEFLANEKYRGLYTPQEQTISYLYGQLDKGIKGIDAHGELYKHRDEYIYFGTDHHWTALGAYYAYAAFMKAQGVEPVPLDKYEVGEASPFLGFLYSACLHESVKNTPDTVRYYKPFVEHEYRYYSDKGEDVGNIIELYWAESLTNKYGIFLGGDSPLGVIKTEVRNGKKIAVVKDSYGNAFVPFLLPHYEEIYVIDPRQFPHNLVKFVEEKEIGEVLFLNYVLVTEHAAFTDLLIGIMER